MDNEQYRTMMKALLNIWCCVAVSSEREDLIDVWRDAMKEYRERYDNDLLEGSHDLPTSPK